jgi:hypothetical protein
MKTTAVTLVLLLISGCVTPQVVQQPKKQIDFANFKSVMYRVHYSERTEFGPKPEDQKYGHETVDLIGVLLGNKLKHLGYQVAEQTPDLVIDVDVTAVKPGNGAARFWIGFGAGRAVTTFNASFTDSAGAKFAAFDGGRSYTGMEMNVAAFPGKDQLSMLAATRSVDQIAQFMQNGGKFPEK